MFGAIDQEVMVLAVLMLALGVIPGLAALSSRRSRTPRFDLTMPTIRYRRLYFGAATAARHGA